MKVAVKLTCSAGADAAVVTPKLAEVVPEEMNTLGGIETTLVSLQAKTTVAPPLGDGPLNVTVAVEEAPPVRLAGLSPREMMLGTPTVKVAVSVAL